VLYSNFVDLIMPELSLAALPELLPEHVSGTVSSYISMLMSDLMSGDVADGTRWRSVRG
jgi:hypothetical protein